MYPISWEACVAADACYSVEQLKELMPEPVPLLDVLRRTDGPWARVTAQDRLWAAEVVAGLPKEVQRLYCDAVKKAIQNSNRLAFGNMGPEDTNTLARATHMYQAGMYMHCLIVLHSLQVSLDSRPGYHRRASQLEVDALASVLESLNGNDAGEAGAAGGQYPTEAAAGSSDAVAAGAEAASEDPGPLLSL